MDSVREAYENDTLHHAYLIEGGTLDELAVFLEDTVDFSTRGNPDFWRAEFETMGIEDARELVAIQQNRALDGGRKIFAVSAGDLTVEAQNSLLKMLEEPTEGTHFFFCMPTSERLVPTLKSRLQIVRRGGKNRTGSLDDALAFLKMNPAARAEYIKPFVNEKDKSRALAFVSEILCALRAGTDLRSASSDQIFALEETEKGRQYLLDRSPSIKLVLEHLAAVLPKAK
jgi:hypothetical protein